MKILISACLLGVPCRYDGKSKENEALCALLQDIELIPICPEQAGGLPTPRPSAEIAGNRVINLLGEDVTAQYRLGAELCLKQAKDNNCSIAILKAQSPSCGYGSIHNGCFDGGLIKGNGICAELLAQNGISVFTEQDTRQIKEALKPIKE